MNWYTTIKRLQLEAKALQMLSMNMNDYSDIFEKARRSMQHVSSIAAVPMIEKCTVEEVKKVARQIVEAGYNERGFKKRSVKQWMEKTYQGNGTVFTDIASKILAIDLFEDISRDLNIALEAGGVRLS